MKNTKLFSLIGAFLASSASGTLVHASTELAKVNSRVITLEEFNKKYQDNLKFFPMGAPSKKGVLEDLIKRELAVQEARKQGLEKDAEISERINTVLYHALLERQLSKEFEKIEIADKDAKNFYAKYPEIRTSHLFVAVKPDASAAEEKSARDKIQKMEAALRSGKMSFAEIAQRDSEGVAAPMGGDIDFQTKDQLDPAYYEAALKLKTPGKVSPIVRTQFGYHVIKLTSVRSWEDADKSAVKRLLFDQRRAELFEKYMASLRKQSSVTVHPELLKD